MNPVSIRTTIGLTATLLGAASQAVSAASVDAAPGFFFSTLPFSDTGTTIGTVSPFTNDIGTLPPGVSDYPTVAGPDVFYTFTVISPGTMTIRVTPLGATGYDPAIYLLKDGTTSAFALIGEDSAGINTPDQITDVALGLGTYYLVVDSFYPSGAISAGAYTLDVSGNVGLAPGAPEPGTAALGLTALAATTWRRRRRGAC